MTDRRGLIAAALLATAALGAPALSAPAPAVAQDDAAEAWTPTWSDDGIASVATMLAGTWRTTRPVAEFGDAGQSDIVMSISPIAIDGASDTLYVETARSDTLYAPYRQAIFQVYRFKGDLRLRTYELLTDDVTRGMFAGLYAAPELFPALTRDDLIATLDVTLTERNGAYAGSTPYPYPTGIGGAVEMTSEVSLSPTSFTTADRGFDADGNIVWGAGENDTYTFERIDPLVAADHRADGIIVIDFVNPGEDVVRAGDKVHTHYTGWLATGAKFDSSRDRGRAFIFDHPAPAGRMIAGWSTGINGISVGTHRKVYLPWEVAYGERGNPAAKIPSQADLIFQIECLYLEHPETPAEGEGGQGEGVQPAGGTQGDGIDHTGHNHP